MSRKTLLALLLALPACAFAADPAPAPDAGTVFSGATVYTAWDQAPRKVSILVKGGKIVFVGDEAEARAAAPAAKSVDLAGAVLTPGLVDAHGHLRGLGALRRMIDCRGISKEEIVRRVKAEVASAAPGAWIRGRAWDQNRWSDTSFPTAADLETAAPKTPVVLQRVDGHALWVNAAALAAAGVTKATPDPPGGRLERLQDGTPTGVLVDNAMALVVRAIPEPRPDEARKDFVAGLEACAKAGLTGVGEASGSSSLDLAILEKLAKDGKLPIRVYATVGPKSLDAALLRGPFSEGRLTVRALKIVADGALGSRGAALLADYSDSAGNRGLDVTAPGEVERLTEKAMRGGFQVWTHAIGDRANRTTLDAYAKALDAVKPSDSRPRIEHAQILAPGDAERFAKLSVIASMQPTHATSDWPWVEARIGKEREKGSYAWRTLLKNGVRLAGGSDFPVESEEPLLGIFAAVTRQETTGKPPGGWRMEEALTRPEALRLFTVDNAYAEFAEKRRGRVAPGFDADFTVLDRDVVAVATPAGEILKTKVVMTVVGGEIVYRAGERP
ncbi:MAG: amidohydrolase [Acidobacteriota bacterium]|nr:amidohydrolase [Acidobacteriota bacterium]